MSKREFVLLAHKYEGKQHIGGWFASEKLDGMRCIWDGGVTRGLPKSAVPWANCAKDARYVTPPVATGLWSRYGNVIHAPDWFLDQLPKIPLDGELYTYNANRQAIFSTIKDIVPTSDWKLIQYHVFDMVPLDFWLMDGQIKNTGFVKTLKGCYNFAMELPYSFEYLPKPMTQFQTTVELFRQKMQENEVLKIHTQTRLPFPAEEAEKQLQMMANEIVDGGGEGVIIRSPISYWSGERKHDILKFKPTDDMEGTVIGYVTGRATDKGSKLLGMMGALVLRLDNGKEMELSGFTDAERTLEGIGLDNEEHNNTEARGWAATHPGESCPEWIQAIAFPRGTRVTFTYRGLSSYGIPQEARYARIWNEA